MRGCCWRIWRGSTGRRRRPWRARMPRALTRCWRCWRGRLRARWSWRVLRARGRGTRCCRRSGRTMSRRWAMRWRRLSGRPGSMRSTPGRTWATRPIWGRRSAGRWRRPSGTAGRRGPSRRWMRCWGRVWSGARKRVVRSSSSRWMGLAPPVMRSAWRVFAGRLRWGWKGLGRFPLDRVNCVNRSGPGGRKKMRRLGNRMPAAMFYWVKAGAVLPPPPSDTASA